MSTLDSRSSTVSSGSSTRMAWASGGVLFAAALMIMNGLFQFFEGISALGRDQILVSTPNYVYRFDTTAWGWIHLLLGIIVAVVGYFVLPGAAWARAAG